MKKMLVLLGALQFVAILVTILDRVVWQVRHKDDSPLMRRLQPMRVQVGPMTTKTALRNAFSGLTEVFEKEKVS